MRKIHTFYFLAFTFYFALANAYAYPLRDWDWHLPGAVYKELDFTQRAQVDRASKLFQQAIDAEGRVKVTELVPLYRNAAGEWRKVQVQGETEDGLEPLLAYAVFMQGYAKQQARDRNEAMKLYNEVLDIYPDQKFIAIPARYMLSNVKREIGDIKQADADLEAIVEDGGANGHVLYWRVISELASIRWGTMKVEEAVELWKKIEAAKGKAPDNLWQHAHNSITFVAFAEGNFADYEASIFLGVPEVNKRRAPIVSESARWVCGGCGGLAGYLERKYPGDKKAGKRKEEIIKLRKQYISWLKSQKVWYDGLDDGWSFAFAMLWAHLGYEKQEALVKRVMALEPLVRGAKPDQIDGRARTLANTLLDFGQGDAARSAAAMIKDQKGRIHFQYEVECRLGAWKQAHMYLTEYMKLAPDDKGAKYDLASLYRNHLGTPEKAIKLYMEIDEPPRTLWLLAETYRQVGKKNESYTTLTEIASVFPNDAPNAVFRMAGWKEQDGDKKMAIGLYRRILGHPQWKQLGVSSAAHQALERLGIATGGAMTNEVH